MREANSRSRPLIWAKSPRARSGMDRSWSSRICATMRTTSGFSSVYRSRRTRSSAWRAVRSPSARERSADCCTDWMYSSASGDNPPPWDCSRARVVASRSCCSPSSSNFIFMKFSITGLRVSASPAAIGLARSLGSVIVWTRNSSSSTSAWRRRASASSS
jgi:hypothetical protein